MDTMWKTFSHSICVQCCCLLPQVAEAAAALEESRMTALTLRAEEAERKLAELGSKRQRQLADITNLK